MPTGACGINCDICKLRLLGTCSSCGPGTSPAALKKIEAQKELFGTACPILACAQLNRLEYCLRDCNAFPCQNFSIGPNPYSQMFLSMQQRRRKERPPALNPNENLVQVPEEYWASVAQKDMLLLCNHTLSEPASRIAPEMTPKGLVFDCLHQKILLDIDHRCLYILEKGHWIKTEHVVLVLLTLLYLMAVKEFQPKSQEMVAPHDLKEAHYFKGRHALKLAPLLERYGNDMRGFKAAAEFLKGKPRPMAEVAYEFLPFPRIPVYYLYWQGDEEFPARISVLFDRSIESFFSASAIWMLVNMISLALIQGPTASGQGV